MPVKPVEIEAARKFFAPHIPRLGKALAQHGELFVAMHRAVQKKEVSIEQLRKIGARYVKLKPEQQPHFSTLLESAERHAQEKGVASALELMSKHASEPEKFKPPELLAALEFAKQHAPSLAKEIESYPPLLAAWGVQLKRDLEAPKTLKALFNTMETEAQKIPEMRDAFRYIIMKTAAQGETKPPAFEAILWRACFQSLKARARLAKIIREGEPKPVAHKLLRLRTATKPSQQLEEFMDILGETKYVRAGKIMAGHAYLFGRASRNLSSITRALRAWSLIPKIGWKGGGDRMFKLWDRAYPYQKVMDIFPGEVPQILLNMAKLAIKTEKDFEPAMATLEKAVDEVEKHYQEQRKKSSTVPSPQVFFEELATRSYDLDYDSPKYNLQELIRRCFENYKRKCARVAEIVK